MKPVLKHKRGNGAKNKAINKKGKYALFYQSPLPSSQATRSQKTKNRLKSPDFKITIHGCKKIRH